MILENGYETKTTFWLDFTIAEKFGANAIKDTFERSFRDWKNNYIYMTELCCVMSWKACGWYKKNDEYVNLYSEYYHKVDGYCFDHLKGDELNYFIRWTD